MRKLMLLVAAGSLWLFLAAIPVFADGGPHSAAANGGVSTLTTDSCAGCHRAHTASAPMLLAQDEEQLCLSCHGAAGTGATTDVATGVQYRVLGSSAPGWTAGAKALDELVKPASGANGHYFKVTTAGTTGASEPSWVPVAGVVNDGTVVWTDQGVPAGRDKTVELGALRGGGFEEARIGDPYRYMIGTSTVNKIQVKNDGAGHTAAAPVTSAHMNLHAAGTALENTGIAWGQGANGTGTGSVISGGLGCASCHNPHGNGKYRILKPVPVDATVNAWVAQVVKYDNGVYTTAASHSFMVGDMVRTQGNTLAGANQGSSSVAAKVATVPTDNTFTLTGVAVAGTGTVGTATLIGGVTVTDAAVAPAAGDARNYTVIQTPKLGAGTDTLLASTVVSKGFTALQGDYFHYKVPWNGTGNVGTGFQYDAPNGVPGTAVTGSDGRVSGTLGERSFSQEITAWCSSCHTRYMAYMQPLTSPADGTTGEAYKTARPGDTTFEYQHRTRGASNRGCLTCHVSHGSNAIMDGFNSSKVEYPNGTTSDSSRLLKVGNRGTCNLCHDPTATRTLADNLPANTVPSVP